MPLFFGIIVVVDVVDVIDIYLANQKDYYFFLWFLVFCVRHSQDYKITLNVKARAREITN